MPVAIATAAAPTSGTLPVAQAIAIDCGGFTPVAVLVLATRASSLATVTDGAMYSAGFTDGTTTRLASAMSEDGQSAATADTGIDYDATSTIVRILNTTSETTDGAADFVSLDVDELNIEWQSLPTDAVQIMVWAFYGEGWQARTGVRGCSDVLNATVSVVGTAFRPAGIISIGARAGFSSSGANADMHFGFAALNSDGTVQGQGCYGLREGDRPALTAAFSGIRNDCIGFMTTLTAEEARYEITEGTADGFKITTRVASGFAYSVGFIALYPNGRRCTAGAVDLGTATTGEKTIAVGLHPEAFFLIGSALSSLNAYSGTAPSGNWSFGVATEDAQGNIGYQAAAVAVTSDTRCVTDDTDIITVISDAGAEDWDASLVSFGPNPDSVVIDITGASSANRHAIFFAIEAETLIIIDETEEISETAALNIGLSLSETEEISETAVLVASTELAASVNDETVEISETAAFLSFSAINSFTDTEEISETSLLILGGVLILTETVEISEESNFGGGLLSTKAQRAGEVVQWAEGN